MTRTPPSRSDENGPEGPAPPPRGRFLDLLQASLVEALALGTWVARGPPLCLLGSLLGLWAMAGDRRVEVARALAALAVLGMGVGPFLGLAQLLVAAYWLRPGPRSRAWALAALALGLALPYLRDPRPASPPGPDEVEVVTFNPYRVWVRSRQGWERQLLASLAGTRPDILVFSDARFRGPGAEREISGWPRGWPQGLAVVSAELHDLAAQLGLPHRYQGDLHPARRDPFRATIHVFSRWPLEVRTGAFPDDLQGAAPPVWVARPEGGFVLQALHLKNLLYTSIARQLEGLGQALDALPAGPPTLVVGDLNLAPAQRRAEVAARGFQDSVEVARGMGGTFPATWPALAIDAALVAGGAQPRRHDPLPRCGSDHLPLRVRVAIPAGGEPPWAAREAAPSHLADPPPPRKRKRRPPPPSPPTPVDENGRPLSP